MFDALTARADAAADALCQRRIARLARLTLPPGVTAEITQNSVVLIGRGLRRRALFDPQLRSLNR